MKLAGGRLIYWRVLKPLEIIIFFGILIAVVSKGLKYLINFYYNIKKVCTLKKEFDLNFFSKGWTNENKTTLDSKFKGRSSGFT